MRKNSLLGHSYFHWMHKPIPYRCQNLLIFLLSICMKLGIMHLSKEFKCEASEVIPHMGMIDFLIYLNSVKTN